MPVLRTADYDRWFSKLRDRQARTRIDDRIARLEQGNAGDVAPIGKGASELRMFFGPGYRVYFFQEGDDIILLYGGDKSTQAGDIAHALSLIED